jgi:AcrR family transcriptional regulator
VKPQGEKPDRVPRLYRGMSAEERRAQRRERLLAAGLELFGTRGYQATSVRDVSVQAGLNSRYFYESFATREELLERVYRRIVREVAAAVIEATAQESQDLEAQARAGLAASWRVFTEDRRKARVVALEVVGVSERLERLRRDSRHAFADIIVRNSLSFVGDVELRLDPMLNARALMGAQMDLLVDWINDDLDASVEEIVEHLTRLFTAIAVASVAPRAGGRRGSRGRARS